jgi:hypothetical protein
MTKFDLVKKSMGHKIILESVGDNYKLIDEMKKNDDGTYDVTLIVGGVELDFKNFAKCIEEQLVDFIEHEAQAIIDSKYSDLIQDIYDIQERIKTHRDKFKWDWED